MPNPSVSPANDRGAMGEGRNLVAASIPQCVARFPGQDSPGSRA
jgi:hypothetical protein